MHTTFFLLGPQELWLRRMKQQKLLLIRHYTSYTLSLVFCTEQISLCELWVVQVFHTTVHQTSFKEEIAVFSSQKKTGSTHRFFWVRFSSCFSQTQTTHFFLCSHLRLFKAYIRSYSTFHKLFFIFLLHFITDGLRQVPDQTHFITLPFFGPKLRSSSTDDAE